MKIWIYWSESNSWISFYIVLNKNWKILLVQTEFYWSWAGGPGLIMVTAMASLRYGYTIRFSVWFLHLTKIVLCEQKSHSRIKTLFENQLASYFHQRIISWEHWKKQKNCTAFKLPQCCGCRIVLKLDVKSFHVTTPLEIFI